jgi:NAD(P)-dependent dehydrogenase (short-subunit alcohol dehydrogenase family)
VDPYTPSHRPDRFPRLKGEVAVIAGSSGIGFATAKRFVEEGPYVFIVGRWKAELNKAVEAIGLNVVACRAGFLITVDKQKYGALDCVIARGLTTLSAPEPA